MSTSQVHLHTGLQGSGKTLRAIVWVKAMAEKEARAVYYSGINGLTLPWELFGGPGPNPAEPWVTDPSEWYKLPNGSIVVIDEAQRLFRPAAYGTQVPEYVTQLETLRHRGITLVLITQSPMLLHANVRRLCGYHTHSVRVFGSQKSIVYTWNRVVTDPENKGVQKSAQSSELFNYPKEAYAWYVSAEKHTITRKVPLKLKLLMAVPFLFLGLCYWAYNILYHPKASTVAAQSFSGAVSPASRSAPGARSPDHVMSVAEYAQSRQPRIAGLPYTAPVYDKVMEPKLAPKPTQCVASATRCSCYTQQGTKIAAVPDGVCRQLVESGFFDDAPDAPPVQPMDWQKQAANGAVLQAPEAASRIYTAPVEPTPVAALAVATEGRGKALPPSPMAAPRLR